MLTATINVRQVLTEWRIVATVHESYGEGLEPLRAAAEYTLGLTSEELELDPLAALTSILVRLTAELSEGSQPGPWRLR